MENTLPTGINITAEFTSIFNDSALDIIRRHGRALKLNRGQTLFNEGEVCNHFYLLTKGLVKLSHTDSLGKTTIVDLVQVGEAMAVGLMESKARIFPLTAIALEPTEVIEFTHAHYLELWKHNQELNSFCVEQIRKHMLNIQKDRTIQSYPLEKRIAYLFIERMKTRKEFPLTRKEISQWLGTSIETVIRTLSLWTKQKIITTENSEIRIINEELMRSKWKD